PWVRLALPAPPVTTAQAKAVGAALERELPGLALPSPRADIVEEIRKDPPVPLLTLVRRRRGWGYWGVRTSDWDDNVDLALLAFGYGGVGVDSRYWGKWVCLFGERRGIGPGPHRTCRAPRPQAPPACGPSGCGRLAGRRR